nr:immunoglobulin heavy chain junction region [Macaca mulatta]MOW32609.1 immunoglobulin heavy chain junction region [Macaca mulatta]MOW33298.1 immunoglobulin heavy chain junction region [Macaca mulatta]MOW33480.1 immunoglobulin heavy chain junction region [Macaca mulatta]MOW33553.1 immunoglobulin heavy chain junction region [Macaca mulatta]
CAREPIVAFNRFDVW